MHLGTIIKRVLFYMHEKIWRSVVPEDVKACVLLQCFCQTSSTKRSNAIGGETKQQCNNHSQMPCSLFDSYIYQNGDIRVVLYLRLVRLGWFFRASANASAPSSPIELPHILQPIHLNNFNIVTFTIVFVLNIFVKYTCLKKKKSWFWNFVWYYSSIT